METTSSIYQGITMMPESIVNLAEKPVNFTLDDQTIRVEIKEDGSGNRYLELYRHTIRGSQAVNIRPESSNVIRVY